MSTKTNRGIGKSDPLDAHRIATAVLPQEADRLRHPARTTVRAPACVC